MNATAYFLLTSVALCAGFAGSGACFLLYLQERTPIVRIFLLFLVSLLCVTAGFWMASLPPGLFPNAQATTIVSALFQFAGVALNIAVSPVLISALLAHPIGPRLAIALRAQNAFVIAAGALYFVLPNPDPAIIFVNVQMVATVGISLVTLFLRLGSVRPAYLKSAAKAFLAISACALPLFALDLAVSRFAIRALAFLDNLSQPAYFLALNCGSFAFVARFHDAGALVENGKITAACRDQYGLTAREAELIERMMDGSTNQELADALFISRKTIENHLYSVYQKMNVKNRVQLIQTMQNWKKEGETPR